MPSRWLSAQRVDEPLRAALALSGLVLVDDALRHSLVELGAWGAGVAQGTIRLFMEKMDVIACLLDEGEKTYVNGHTGKIQRL